MKIKLTFENKEITPAEFKPLDLVISIDIESDDTLIIQCARQENETVDTFSGMVMRNVDGIYLGGEYKDGWHKSSFGRYIGKITMESS